MDPTQLIILRSTFIELTELLTYSIEQIKWYLQQKISIHGQNWLPYYLWYIYTQPPHIKGKILDVFEEAPNKPAAAYLACIFTAYFTNKSAYEHNFPGLQVLEDTYKNESQLRVLSNGKHYTFHLL